MANKQIDCFSTNIKFWKFLGIWPENVHSHYKYYSHLFLATFVYLYWILFSINFIYLPRQLDTWIGEMIFYFTDISCLSKVLTFRLMHDHIAKLLNMLEGDIFQPATDEGLKIIADVKKFNVKYWKIMAVVSVTSHFTHIFSPLLAHLISHVKLELPVSRYSFIPEKVKEQVAYPLYFYQTIGMHFLMWYNINIDTFFLAIMMFAISQLEILNLKLRNITSAAKLPRESRADAQVDVQRNDEYYVHKLTECIIHYTEVSKFCELIQNIFSITLFIQFSVASCIICICLFRFTLPAPLDYYIFLATYTFIMVIQIMLPCWFGTRIMDKSYELSMAVYSCDWTARSRRFKTNLRLFVERTNRPLSIIGGLMFTLSLSTFTSIMNSAYSFFTLLRHMQSREG